MTVHLPRLRAWLPLSGLVLAAAGARGADPIDAVGKAAGEWVKTRAETVRLESQWTTDRMLLESTVHSLKERAAALEEKRDQARSATAEERAEIEKMTAKNRSAAEELAGVEKRLQAVSASLLAMRPALPPRLSEALEMSYRSLAENKASPGERMQLVMGVLNRCAQFNAMVNSGDEVLALEGEPNPKSVEVIYWGLSHGYALDRPAGRAWLGRPVDGRWTWRPAPDAARAVGELISIHRAAADPAFVTVPAHLGNSAASR